MACLLSVLFGMVTVSAAPTQENPATIAVVQTWEQLQALPPIDLGNGVKIRLGLEANKIPQWSGVLLYCLTEGYIPPSGGRGREPFGPVHADFTYERDQPELNKQVAWGGPRLAWKKGAYLYVRSLPADRVGTYHITVTGSQGRVVARTQVEGTRDFFHPWMPWIDGYDKRVSPSAGIALPCMETLRPVVFVEPGVAKKGRLPTLLPGDERPALTIQLTGKTIVIRAESEFTSSRPDYHFLARWWVNDKPFVPKQADPLGLMDGYGRVSEDKELSLELEFRPERLGARPGDKIGLQLMHSESAWAWCASTALAKAAAWPKHGENTRVSNRIEFQVPKRD